MHGGLWRLNPRIRLGLGSTVTPMCLKSKSTVCERTLTSMTDPELVNTETGVWQLTGKIDGLDVADLEQLQSQIGAELREWDNRENNHVS